MALLSARFRGDPVLERIAGGDTSAFLRFGARGDHVRAVQFALIDLGFSIPDGATGLFANQTSAAVVKFKTEQGLKPNDPVVGVGTITALDQAWALPFADRDEWLQGQVRPIPEFNHTREHELARIRAGRSFTFNPLTNRVPGAFKAAILRGLQEILNTQGSPAGDFTPSATWGLSPLDLYHCHVVVDQAGAAPSWAPLRNDAEKIHRRMLDMMSQADRAGPEGFPPWTAEYRRLLLAPGTPNYIDQFMTLLDGLLRNSIAENQTIKLVWHTFERPLWRPVDVGSDSPRRAWWNDVAPVPSGVTVTPFPVSAFGNNVMELVELAFLVDRNLVITLLGQTLTEVSALVGLDKARIEAAVDGLPFS